MDSDISRQRGRKYSARRDIAIVILISVTAAIICVKFDISEAVSRWSRPHENLQLDELPGILLVVALCLAWFSYRRYFEANRQLSLRRSAEARLADALAENQRLALKYVDMQEHERKVLAHDLHDEMGQYLNAIKLDAVAIRDCAPSHAAVGAAARAMIVNIDRVDEVLRGLIRQLRPVGFDDLGLVAALEHCANEWRSRAPATQIELSCAANLGSLGESSALVIFRLVQEGLTNVSRHASASFVRIEISRSESPPGIGVLIADNGCGADLGRPRTGLGLIGMRERVAALGGSVALRADRGAGFEIAAFLPLSDPDAE